MKNKTVCTIDGRTELELVKKINEDQRDFFATQPKQKIDGTWVCFCYYHSYGGEKKSEPIIKNLATEKQKEYLYGLNADFDAETITKKEADNLIKRLKKDGGGDRVQ